MSPAFNQDPPSGRVAPLWLERVPTARYTSLAAAATGALALLVGFFAARHDAEGAAAEIGLAAVALAVLLRAPTPSLSLAPALAAVGIDVWSGNAFEPRTAAFAFALAGMLVAASQVRMGILRRDAELVVAADVVQDTNEREAMARRLTRVEERSWLQSEIARGARHEYAVSVLLVRPDSDALPYGALLQLADVVTRELRAGDAAIRQDKSTFALVLPATPAEGARVAAERTRLAVASAGIAGGTTVAIGIASYPADGGTSDDVVRASERALARAVALGGNRTVCASLAEAGPSGWTLSGSRRLV